jgi:hypothetical protein
MTWQPIETAPKDNDSFILAAEPLGKDDWILFVAYYDEFDRKWSNPAVSSDAEAQCYEPTHWMPLSNPPSGDQETSLMFPKVNPVRDREYLDSLRT